MADSEFLRPRLCGARFDGGSIPLDVLGDLKALGVMLIEVAKWVFLQKNPERHDLPGFADGVTQADRIRRLECVPVIGRSSSPKRCLISNNAFSVSRYLGSLATRWLACDSPRRILANSIAGDLSGRGVPQPLRSGRAKPTG